MQIVYKYSIPISAFGTGLYLDLPKGARLLSVGEQNGELMLWALVEQGETMMEGRLVHVIGTGHPLVPNFLHTTRDFIGTVQMQNGIVLHVFEER